MKRNIKKLLIVNSGKGGNFKRIFPLLRSKGNFQIFVIIYNSESLNKFCVKNNIETFYIKKTSRQKLDKLLFNYASLIKPNVTLLFYNYIIKKNFLDKFKFVFNLHYTLLPKFKGLDGFEKSLKSKHSEIGCTLHIAEEKFDEGKIIIQKKIKNLSKESLNIKKQKIFLLGIRILKLFFSDLDYYLKKTENLKN